ncbi:MAG: thymidine phosphorylase [Clostridia bacterium]|nr:thymidine phosphorylase [Clostridia bacterium]
MYIYDIIEKKRYGNELTKEEIEFTIAGFVKGDITEAQMSALLMAITINGMTDKEALCLTKTMQNSGKSYKFPFKSVDKHSTGGVGDSTTLIVVPTLAAMGLRVSKMSGKALGFTGGTIDKMKCFDGYNPEMSEEKFLDIIRKCGCVIMSQSSDIAVADKLIYALRDKTATVDSIPLIASSIMSKKLASGADTILLDVKYGTGAFMKTIDDAKKLAKLMVKIGKADGRNVNAVITNMNVPLSDGVGCNQEVYSAIKVLHGENSRLAELSKYLCAKLYSEAKGKPFNECKKMVSDAIASGKAAEKLREMVMLGGGNADIIDHPEKLLISDYVVKVTSKKNTYVNNINAYKVAKFVNHLKDSAVEKQKYRAGIMLNVHVGDEIHENDTLATIYSSRKVTNEMIEELLACFEFSDKYSSNYKLIEESVK